MPLDPVAHLTRQGWKGKGSGFKADSISRPLAVKMKTSLGGVGKDRDEAFPFWDHVFAAAASSIIIPSPSDSNSSSSRSTSPEPTAVNPTVILHRTSTGILSPYAPSGSVTPIPDALTAHAGGAGSALNQGIMASAQREAARRGLYQGFCKGAVLKGKEVEKPVVVKKAKMEIKPDVEPASSMAVKVQQVLVVPSSSAEASTLSLNSTQTSAAESEPSSLSSKVKKSKSSSKTVKPLASSSAVSSSSKRKLPELTSYDGAEKKSKSGKKTSEEKDASRARKAERAERRERKAKRRTEREGKKVKVKPEEM